MRCRAVTLRWWHAAGPLRARAHDSALTAAWPNHPEPSGRGDAEAGGTRARTPAPFGPWAEPLRATPRRTRRPPASVCTWGHTARPPRPGPRRLLPGGNPESRAPQPPRLQALRGWSKSRDLGKLVNTKAAPPPAPRVRRRPFQGGPQLCAPPREAESSAASQYRERSEERLRPGKSCKATRSCTSGRQRSRPSARSSRAPAPQAPSAARSRAKCGRAHARALRGPRCTCCHERRGAGGCCPRTWLSRVSRTAQAPAGGRDAAVPRTEGLGELRVCNQPPKPPIATEFSTRAPVRPFGRRGPARCGGREGCRFSTRPEAQWLTNTLGFKK